MRALSIKPGAQAPGTLQEMVRARAAGGSNSIEWFELSNKTRCFRPLSRALEDYDDRYLGLAPQALRRRPLRGLNDARLRGLNRRSTPRAESTA